MSVEQYESVARQLAESYGTKSAIAPPRELIEGLDLDGAYRIQQFQEQWAKDRGRTIVGRKIGLTSQAMQQQLGVDEPDFGFITDTQLYAVGDHLEAQHFLSPRVEPELAFSLGADLGAGTTREQAADAVEDVFLALEVIDSRVRYWDISLVDTVADNASCGAAVIGPSISVDAHDVAALREVSTRLFVGGTEESAGSGADVLGDPLAPLVWLANELGARGGGLRAGEFVLTGSFCAAAPVSDNMEVVADFGEHGVVSAFFD